MVTSLQYATILHLDIIPRCGCKAELYQTWSLTNKQDLPFNSYIVWAKAMFPSTVQ